MIEKEQIAHDLAVAKLYGSDLCAEELIKQYRKYKDEILSDLNSELQEHRKTTIMRNFM